MSCTLQLLLTSNKHTSAYHWELITWPVITHNIFNRSSLSACNDANMFGFGSHAGIPLSLNQSRLLFDRKTSSALASYQGQQSMAFLTMSQRSHILNALWYRKVIPKMHSNAKYSDINIMTVDRLKLTSFLHTIYVTSST